MRNGSYAKALCYFTSVVVCLILVPKTRYDDCGIWLCYFLVIFILVFFRLLPVFIDFSLTVKAATLIFISGRGSAISSAKQGKSGSIYYFW